MCSILLMSETKPSPFSSQDQDAIDSGHGPGLRDANTEQVSKADPPANEARPISQVTVAETAKEPHNHMRLVCHCLDSIAMRDAEEASYFTNAWKRMRQFGHAPILVYRTSMDLAGAQNAMLEVGLVSPEYLICGTDHLVYDNCNDGVLIEWSQEEGQDEDWAYQWLLEWLGVPPQAAAFVVPEQSENRSLIDWINEVEARLRS